MSATDDVIELSLRYSDSIARAERAEAEVAMLRAALIRVASPTVDHAGKTHIAREALRPSPPEEP